MNNEKSSTEIQEFQIKKKIKILFFGDSVTFRGNTSWSYATYAIQSLAANHSEYNIISVNKGIPGNCVADLLERLENDVILENPDYISILIGVNDTATWRANVSEEEFKLTYETILNTINQKLPNAKIILMTPFVVYENSNSNPELLGKRIDCIKQLANEKSLTLVDTNALFVSKQNMGKEKDYSEDGIHPNEFGARLIAEDWIKSTHSLF